MKEVGIFESKQTLSNSTIIVSFSPYENVKTYTYQIFKDSVPYGSPVTKKSKVNIVLNENGKYYINIKTNIDGIEYNQHSEVYRIDTEKPIIELQSDNLKIKENINQKITENVKAYDNIDGNITEKISTNIDSLNLKTDKTQKLIYTVQDSAGNISSKTAYIKVYQDKSYVFIMLSVFVSLLVIMTYFIDKILKALDLEKRLEPFTVKTFKERKSLSERLLKTYQNLTKRICKYFKKSIFIQRYTKKIEKYLPVSILHESADEMFAGKILISTFITLIAIITRLIKLKLLESYEIVVIFTLGFFSLDIFYIIKYKIYRQKLESDFIAAITIMNNSFKSGRSIMQAIETVAKELKGPIGREFNRMSLELLYGLGIDVVFKRFSERIEIEEASYLTASLTILNKTGGDIIKVFDSIENSMYDKRKLKLELKSLTSGSRIVIGVLLGMPFFFCLVIGLINPEYFIPFLTTKLGLILLIFMIFYYIIFVVVVRKVMKVVI